MFVADTKEKIALVQLMSLRGAVKLEAIGLKRRGRSATMIAKTLLGLSRGCRRDKVLVALQARIDEAKQTCQDAQASCIDNRRPIYLKEHPQEK